MDIEGKGRLIEFIRDGANLVTKDEALDFALELVAGIIQADQQGESMYLEQDGVLEEVILLYRRKVLPACVLKTEERACRANQNPEQ